MILKKIYDYVWYILRNYIVRCYDWFNLLVVVQFSFIAILKTSGSRLSPQRHDSITDHLLRKEEDYKLFVNNLFITAALIATISFAAAFTVPGGYKSEGSNDPGTPILLKHVDFQLFLIFDTVAMTTSIMVLLLLLHSRLGSKNFQIRQLSPAIVLLQYSTSALMLAFLSGLFLVTAGKHLWLHILIWILCTITFLYIFIFSYKVDEKINQVTNRFQKNVF